jgi:hypothetical protein
MSSIHVHRAGLGLFALLALPTVASAEPLTAVGVFNEATLVVKVILLGLIVVTLAAIVVSTLKVASGPRLSGGSAFLSGLRVGGPLAGLVGAAYSGLNMALNLANVAQPAPVNILARGASEVLMVILLGLVAGSVAVIANWAVEARIDRTVLGA